MLSPQPNYTPPAGSDHRQRLLNRLSQLAKLGDDWDGEGSCGPSGIIIEKARELVDELPVAALIAVQMPERDLYATAYGTLVLDWTLFDGRVAAAIEISNSGYSGFLFRPDQSSLTFDRIVEVSKLPVELHRLWNELNGAKSYFVEV